MCLMESVRNRGRTRKRETEPKRERENAIES